MDKRLQVLDELREYIEKIDQDATLLLQNIQWDPKHLTQRIAMDICKYDSNHRIPVITKEDHENQCYLIREGYTKKDILLPDPIDYGAKTVISLSKQDIQQIINNASLSNPNFKKGSSGAEPLTVERLQQAYSADERSAIHDAVVRAAPCCHDLTDLALASDKSEGTGPKAHKSRAEVLSELRDMKRRRARYRLPAHSAHYSHVLRGLIRSQMELYAEAKGIFIKTEYDHKSFTSVKEPPKDTINTKEIIVTEIKQERSENANNHYYSSERYKNHQISERYRSDYDGNRRNQYDGDKRRDNNERSSFRSRTKHEQKNDSHEEPKYRHRREDGHSKYEKYKPQREQKYKERHCMESNNSQEGHRSKYGDYREYDRHNSHRHEKGSRDRPNRRNYECDVKDEDGYTYKRKRDREARRDRDDHKHLKERIPTRKRSKNEEY